MNKLQFLLSLATLTRVNDLLGIKKPKSFTTGGHNLRTRVNVNLKTVKRKRKKSLHRCKRLAKKRG